MPRQRKKTAKARRRFGPLFLLLIVIPAAVLLLLAGLNWVVMPLLTRMGQELEVPDVTGLAREEAEKLLKQFNLRLGEVRVVGDTLHPPGHVVTQSPPGGRMVKPGRIVSLDVSRGADRVVVPELIDLRLEDAIAELEAVGLRIANVESLRTPDIAPGMIMAVRPAAGTELDRNETVILAVSASAGKFPMPNLTGTNIETATGIVANQRLILGAIREAPSDEPIGMVMLQYPEEGTPVMDGDTVTLIVASPLPPAPNNETDEE